MCMNPIYESLYESHLQIPCASGIDCAERALLHKLYWADRPVINNVDPTSDIEPNNDLGWVEALRERIAVAMDVTSAVPARFLRCLDEYVSFNGYFHLRR